MNIYSAFPLPFVSYGLIHRPKNGVPRERYEETILEMHRRVEEESALFTAGQEKSVDAVTARQAQILRGSLSQFLATPIRSDDAEVQKIFLEVFNELLAQAAVGGQCGAVASWAGRSVTSGEAQGLLKKLESNGRRYVRSLGLESGKGGTETYESMYVVRGGGNLDVLEHIVRDRLGIYDSPHGQHIGDASPFAVAAHNLVHSSGNDYMKSLPAAWGEAAFYFEKPAVPYAEFRSSVAAAIDAALRESASPAASLWQRKLGMGRGNEFALRFILPARTDAAALVESLKAFPPLGKEAFARDVSLLVKEIIHPRQS
ncbi:MAG TPA: hypothetical protein VL221_14835 [Bacteroidota bacterium]|nr:hypothetical protein [Bacteroidota bacterium]